jgi:hypothetical protein
VLLETNLKIDLYRYLGKYEIDSTDWSITATCCTTFLMIATLAVRYP